MHCAVGRVVVSNGGALGAHRICRNPAPGADGEPVRDRWVRKMTTALRSAVDMRKGSKICEHGLLASFHPPGLFVAAAQRPTLCVQLPVVQAGQEPIQPQRPQSHPCLQSAQTRRRVPCSQRGPRPTTRPMTSAQPTASATSAGSSSASGPLSSWAHLTVRTPRAPRPTHSPTPRRHRRRHPVDAHRERVQRLQPGVLHRHGVPPLRVLLHPAVRSVVPPFAPTPSHSPPPGRLADILGRRGAMLLALTLFGEPRPK